MTLESKLTKQEQIDLYGFPLNKETLSINSIVQNRTLLYLSKIFKLYDINLYNAIKRLKPVAIGIDDYLYNRIEDTYLFVLISTSHNINKVLSSPIFETHYIFDDITSSKLRMLVFKFPTEYSKYFDTFQLSKYSEMYSLTELDKIFVTVNDKKDYSYSVLLNTNARRIQFLKLTNEMFKSTLTLNDISQSDFPIKLENEIFNYNDGNRTKHSK